MSHLDPEQLALLALGEPVASEAERGHLAQCADCAADLAEMTHAAGVARSTVADGELDLPSSRVWESIHEELRLGTAVAQDPMADAAPSSPGDTSKSTEQASTETDVQTPTTSPDRRVRRRRSPRALWTLAASLVLVAAVGTAAWIGISSTLTPVSVAAASLDAFPDHPDAVGTAEVDEDRDGVRTLTVSLEGATTADEYREVWLIRNDGQALISLGVLEDTTGTFAIPAGLDLDEYDLVDISFEPLDGDPAHSGNSIVRGRLDAV
ncbi:MAG: anti-sigma factor domain-containing protein [Actinomycetota bacterium]